jgi:hypothetical protein
MGKVLSVKALRGGRQGSWNYFRSGYGTPLAKLGQFGMCLNLLGLLMATRFDIRDGVCNFYSIW